MKLESIRFNTHETYLGTFHKITIIVNDPDDENKYRGVDYWSTAGYSLTALLDQLIEKLNGLVSNSDFQDLTAS